MAGVLSLLAIFEDLVQGSKTGYVCKTSSAKI